MPRDSRIGTPEDIAAFEKGFHSQEVKIAGPNYLLSIAVLGTLLYLVLKKQRRHR